MPAKIYDITPLSELTLESVNLFVAELNDVLARLSVDLLKIQGLENMKPEIYNDIDFKGKRLMNIGKPREGSDVPNVDDLKENALYVDRQRNIHRAGRKIVAEGGIEVPRAAQEADAVPLAQLDSTVPLASSSTPAAVADSGAVGTGTAYARADHAHEGVAKTGAQTIAGNKTFSNDVEIDGALNHDGSTVGFYGTAPTTQAAASAALTDNTCGTVDGDVDAVAATCQAGAGCDTVDITDVPSKADVDTRLSTINDNTAELAAKVNDALAALRGVGLIAT